MWQVLADLGPESFVALIFLLVLLGWMPSPRAHRDLKADRDMWREMALGLLKGVSDNTRAVENLTEVSSTGVRAWQALRQALEKEPEK